MSQSVSFLIVGFLVGFISAVMMGAELDKRIADRGFMTVSDKLYIVTPSQNYDKESK